MAPNFDITSVMSHQCLTSFERWLPFRLHKVHQNERGTENGGKMLCYKWKINKISKVNHGNDDRDIQHTCNEVIGFDQMVYLLLRW